MAWLPGRGSWSCPVTLQKLVCLTTFATERLFITTTVVQSSTRLNCKSSREQPRWFDGQVSIFIGLGGQTVVVGDESCLRHWPPSQPIVKFYCNSQVSTHRGQSFLHFKHTIRQRWITNNQQQYFTPSGKSCHSSKTSEIASLVTAQNWVLHRLIRLTTAVSVAAFSLCFLHPWIFVHLCLLHCGEVHCGVDACFLLETEFVRSKHIFAEEAWGVRFK